MKNSKTTPKRILSIYEDGEYRPIAETTAEELPQNKLDDKLITMGMTLTFTPFNSESKIENESRALVKCKDGYIEFAHFVHGKWIDEGSYNNSGGIGGDITDNVALYSIV